jgi:hypothetical protein
MSIIIEVVTTQNKEKKMNGPGGFEVRPDPSYRTSAKGRIKTDLERILELEKAVKHLRRTRWPWIAVVLFAICGWVLMWLSWVFYKP